MNSVKDNGQNQYFGIEEDKVHLYECENHTGGRGHSSHDVTAARVIRHFKELSEFQSRIDHAPNSKNCSSE